MTTTNINEQNQVIDILQKRLKLRRRPKKEFVTRVLLVVKAQVLESFLPAPFPPPLVFLCASWNPVANELFRKQLAIIDDQWNMDGESDCEHMDDENDSVPHYEVDVREDVVWLYGDRAE